MPGERGDDGDLLDVCGVGSALVDVLVETSPAVVESAGLIKGSMQLMDLPASERVHAAVTAASTATTAGDAGRSVERSGGSVANTVAGLAAMGAPAGFIGRIADDRLGRVFADDLAGLGVEFAARPGADGTGGGVARPGAGTGRCLILVTPDADRTMCTTLGVAALLGPDDLDLELIRRSRVTYLEGYLWDEPKAKDAFRVAIDAAHAAGRRAAMSMSDPFCVDRHRDEFAALAAKDLDLLFGNEHELCSLMEVDDLDEACRRVRRPGLLVTVTLGARGALAFDGADGSLIEVGIEHDPAVVDTTGAGDLYAAGFLYGLARGRDLATCARVGNLAAGEVISHVGARPEVDLAPLVAATLAG
jgi:sugar/nucleoside kinase (ribokinase family)